MQESPADGCLEDSCILWNSHDFLSQIWIEEVNPTPALPIGEGAKARLYSPCPVGRGGVGLLTFAGLTTFMIYSNFHTTCKAHGTRKKLAKYLFALNYFREITSAVMGEY